MTDPVAFAPIDPAFRSGRSDLPRAAAPRDPGGHPDRAVSDLRHRADAPSDADHGPRHEHDHDHGHEHEHDPGHGAVAPRALRVSPSLYRLSLASRLGLAAVLSAGLWVAVAWALTPIAGE